MDIYIYINKQIDKYRQIHKYTKGISNEDIVGYCGYSFKLCVGSNT